MRFTAEADGHRVEMDTKSPIGTDAALTPKQLLLAGICGCTAMDVVALLKKYKQLPSSFRIELDASTTDGPHPHVFKEVKLIFKLAGEIEPAKLLEAVTLSQTKYCGVSAMVSKAVPISYVVELNGNTIGTGKAEFA